MKIGTYYYPEQWPQTQWARDFDNMRAMGLQIVHMGEFAWFTMEPREGDHRLDWLDQCLSLAQDRKLHVILCTPTAAPPSWLIEKHSQILPVDDAGRRIRFGGRRHYSPLSADYRDAVARLVTALAVRFGDHPAVIGWQIDNEYSGDFDQSETTHVAFRHWLRDTYGTIEAVNEAWGCQFWNTYYTDFSQIMMPAGRVPKYQGSVATGNPHQALDASRFWSQAFASFNKMQADILRPHIGSRFLTTNFMPFHPDCNPKDLSGDLSVMSWDAYPVTGLERNPSTEHYRMGDPAAIGFIHDQMASYTGRWAQLELQPGQQNWSGVPALLYPGAVRLWIWTAFAHGAEFLTTYRYRQPRFGIELFHSALMGTDGVTPTIGGREFAQAIEEMHRIDHAKLSADPANTFDPASTVGILFDFEQLWYYQSLPQAKRWDYQQWLQSWYGACARQGLAVKILHPDTPWPQGLKLILAPGVQMVDEKLIARLTEYTENGGHVLLTCRTALMDRRGQLWEGPTAAPILPLINSTIEAYDSLPEGKFGEIEFDGKKYKWGVWGDLLYAGPNARVVAKYADQFYAGAAAVTRCNHGKGTVTYCGVYAEWPFVEALVEKLAPAVGLTVTKMPWRVHLLQRGVYRIALNYNDSAVEIPAKRTATFIIGSRKLPPAGVAVWVE